MSPQAVRVRTASGWQDIAIQGPPGPPGSAQYVTVAQFAALIPTNGMEVYLVVDATNGVIWHLRYNAGSASAYKWEFVGGPPMHVNETGSYIYGTASYAADSTTPSLTLPRGGDYLVPFGVNSFMSGTVAFRASSTIKIGSAAAGDAERISHAGPSPSSSSNEVSGNRILRLLGRSAGDVLTMYHKSEGGQALGYRDRWIEAIPVRLS